MNILYNLNHTEAINEYCNEQIIGNKIIDNYHEFQDKKNLIRIPMTNKYKYRPDRVAYEYYGSDSFYPIVLACNNLRSLLDFIPGNLGNEIYLMNSDKLKQILEI